MTFGFPVLLSSDTFENRTLAPGTGAAATFGTASDGEPYSIFTYSANVVVGVAASTLAGFLYSNNGSPASFSSLLGSQVSRDVSLSARFSLGLSAGSPSFYVYLRWLDANNWYRFAFSPTSILFQKCITGSIATLATVATGAPLFADVTNYRARIRAQGVNCSVKWWTDGAAEPAAYGWTGGDTNILLSGGWGLGATTSSSGAAQSSTFIAGVQVAFFEVAPVLPAQLVNPVGIGGYLGIVGGADRSQDSDISGMEFDEAAGDHMPTTKLTVYDDGDSPVSVGQEVIILDSNAPPNQTMNLLLNPTLQSPLGTTILVQPQPPGNPSGNWTYQSTSDRFVTPGSPVTITVNNAVDDVYLFQFTQPNNLTYTGVTGGVTYCLSFSLWVIAPLVNANPLLHIRFLKNGFYQGVAVEQTFLGMTGPRHFSMTATAPAGADQVEVWAGLRKTNASNSGSIAISCIQLEPVWFPYLTTYPTADCTPAQPGCYVMPSGVTVRQSRLFAGMVITTKPDYEAEPSRTWELTCQGASTLLEKQFVSLVVTSSYDDDMIIGQVAALYGNLLTTNHVERGALIDQRVYDLLSLQEMCQDCSNTTGFTYYVDAYYDTHYEPFGSNPALYGYSDAPDGITSFAYHDWIPGADITQLGNRITVIGAQFVGTFEDGFTASGSQSRFFLTQKPIKRVTSVKKNGVEQVKGINGNALTTFALGSQCLIDFPSASVLFPSNLAGGTSVDVVYEWDGQIRAQQLDLISHDTYKMWVDRKVTDNAITTTAAAAQRALQEAAIYAYAMLTPEFKTYVPAVAGQIVLLTSAADNLSNAPYLVQSVQANPKGGGVIEYYVKCGADIPTFTRLQKRLHKFTTRSAHLAGIPLSSLSVSVRDIVRIGADSCVPVPNPPY
jgi:hypothetical protein